MTQPELFDVVELLVDIPQQDIKAGMQGAIVEDYGNNDYEVEISNSDGETLALCALSAQDFIVVWQSKTKHWVSLTDEFQKLIVNLSPENQRHLLKYARSLANPS